MKANRIFWPQEVLDQWIVEEKISIEGEELTINSENRTYRMNQAIYFEADVGDDGDIHSLVGRVKDKSELDEMGAEHYMDSVLIEDSAYQVVPGFTGLLLIEVKEMSGGRAVDLSDAFASHSGKEEEVDDRELLARFLIENL